MRRRRHAFETTYLREDPTPEPPETPLLLRTKEKDFDATANIMATRFDAVVVVGKSTFGSQRCDEIERRYPKKVQHKKGHKAAERRRTGVRDWTTAEGFGGGVTKKKVVVIHSCFCPRWCRRLWGWGCSRSLRTCRAECSAVRRRRFLRRLERKTSSFEETPRIRRPTRALFHLLLSSSSRRRHRRRRGLPVTKCRLFPVLKLSLIHI